MMTKTQAENADIILHQLLQKTEHNEKLRVFVDEIDPDLKLTPDEVLFLMQYMANNIIFENDYVVNFKEAMFSSWISRNHNTAKFYEYGGCVKFYEQQKQFEEQRIEREKLENQKLRNDIQSFRIKKWQFVITALTAIGGLVLSLFLFFNQIYNWF